MIFSCVRPRLIFGMMTMHRALGAAEEGQGQPQLSFSGVLKICFFWLLFEPSRACPVPPPGAGAPTLSLVCTGTPRPALPIPTGAAGKLHLLPTKMLLWKPNAFFVTHKDCPLHI